MPVTVAVRINDVLRDSQTDRSTDSGFPIYSITKTLIAICALRLAEAGAIRLDAPVRDWRPEVGLPVTVALTHVLQHTSGLRDYGPLPEYHRAVRTHPDLTATIYPDASGGVAVAVFVDTSGGPRATDLEDAVVGHFLERTAYHYIGLFLHRGSVRRVLRPDNESEVEC
jgi:CubicO group peptidase (beta-lactamase class C family)